MVHIYLRIETLKKLDLHNQFYLHFFNLIHPKHFNLHKSWLQTRMGSESRSCCCCCCCYCCCDSVSVHQGAVTLKLSNTCSRSKKMRVVWQRAPCGLLNIHVACSRTPLISHSHVYGGGEYFWKTPQMTCSQTDFFLSQTFQNGN